MTDYRSGDPILSGQWVRMTWRSQRAPECAALPGCVTLADGTRVHSMRCPLHNAAGCPACLVAQ